MSGVPVDWTLLGIAPTTDADGIRSAFRARLLAFKREGRHEDVAVVQPLREAYQAALRGSVEPAPGEVAAQPPVAAAPVPGPPTEPPPGPPPGPPPAPAPASAPTPPPQSAPPDIDLRARARSAVQALLPDGAMQPHLLRRWRHLRARPAWQRPEAARALQRALAMRLVQLKPVFRAHQPPCEAVAAARRQAQRWLALALHAGERDGWWPVPKTPAAAYSAENDLLWDLVCRVWVDVLLQLLHAGQQQATLDHLGRMLVHPVLQALDNRTSWLHTCAPELAAWTRLPADLLEQLLRGVGLQDLPPGEVDDPALDDLIQQHQQNQRQRLLQRIAQRQLAHPHISPAIAAALLQPAIRPEDRRAVRSALRVHGQLWLQQMRQAIAWLREHEPDALDPTEPAVLRWWCGPQLTPKGWWEAAALLGAMLGSWVGLAAFAACFSLEAVQAGTAALWIGLLAFPVAGMALGARLGWRAGIGLSWLHIRWATWLYPAWRRRDAAWSRRIPVIGSLLPVLGIWLSRDVLVLVALLQWGGAGVLWPYVAFAAWRVSLWMAARGSF